MTSLRISSCWNLPPHPYRESRTRPPSAQPLKVLDTLPDTRLAQFLLRGIEQGFRIGVSKGASFKSTNRNLKSAYEHPDVVSAYIKREVELGRLLPLSAGTLANPALLQLSPFGVIPKKGRPDKWRLIVDLSSPKGQSVNDAISREFSSVAYTSIDRAAELVRSLGAGCLLAKLDLKEAYRAVPVHPSDQRLLAVSWQGAVYINKALPFGLRSAPKIFSALTDSMMWILQQRGVHRALHYLDDFLVLGPPDEPECGVALRTTLSLCKELGFPVAPEKTEGPVTSLVFLGIVIDTVRGQLRLPQEKLVRLNSTIN